MKVNVKGNGVELSASPNTGARSQTLEGRMGLLTNRWTLNNF